jgi:2-keto-3-deoxy-L-fuconate dehydrogenase
VTQLSNKVVLITGAARGLGKTIATRCVAEGASVALVDLDPAVADVASELGGLGIVGDVTDPELPRRAVEQTGERFGPVTSLVNNAFIPGKTITVVDTPDDEWDAVLAVNLDAPFRFMRAAVPAMIEAGGGSIVNIASINATRVGPGSCGYCASKAALVSLTRTVAVHFAARGVRCNTISPGSIDTGRVRDPRFAEQLASLHPAGRRARPEEVAALCVFLLSDDAGFCNGADYLIDGARLAATLPPGWEPAAMSA